MEVLMIKTRLITDYINSLIGQPRVFGENDCNLVACKIIDIHAGSDLYEKLYQKYDSIEDGVKKAKELCGYSHILQPIKEKFKLVEELEDGDLLVTEHKLGRRKYYSVALYFSGYVLIADENDIWVTRPVYEIDYESAYRFGGE
ncbi:hypothetical protein J9089_003262 [Salmonella enterica]|nr:hypothetical protein [Salmonella enterica]EHI7757794.1 hypothetical protein [Salmonella enterica]EHI8762937.1 hypothetical protein [Salmonella enterica]